MTTSTVERILESAETQARKGGYNSFSFRGISNDIGIKSSSIHYHFPTKSDLAAALAKRYRERFAANLEQIRKAKDSFQLKIDAYVDLFRRSHMVDRKMCLCGVFAAEIEYLPQPVKMETKKFFEQNLAWLKNLFQEQGMEPASSSATQILAALEGGLLLARTFDAVEYFDLALEFTKKDAFKK